MTFFDKLVKEALKSCKWRGHKMLALEPLLNRIGGFARCKKCKKEVMIILKPLPNEIEISGEAVALNCEREKHVNT